MAFTSSRGTFTTARGTIHAYPAASGTDWRMVPGVEVYMRAMTGPIYLGGTSVTKTTGYGLLAGSAMNVNVDAGETLCGVTASGTSVVQILKSTRD
jgi:hypothetical protein